MLIFKSNNFSSLFFIPSCYIFLLILDKRISTFTHTHIHTRIYLFIFPYLLAMTDTSDLKPEHTERLQGSLLLRKCLNPHSHKENNRPLQLHRLQSVQLQQRKTCIYQCGSAKYPIVSSTRNIGGGLALY